MRREGLSYQRMAQLDANAQSHNRVATDEEAAVVVDVGRDAASVVAAGSVASRKAEQSEGGRAAPSNAESTSSTLGNQPHHLAQPNLGPSQLLRLAATVFCCLAWTMASSAAILVNKHILVGACLTILCGAVSSKRAELCSAFSDWRMHASIMPVLFQGPFQGCMLPAAMLMRPKNAQA